MQDNSNLRHPQKISAKEKRIYPRNKTYAKKKYLLLI